MTPTEQDKDLMDTINSIVYGADWKTELGEDAHLPQTEAIMEIVRNNELNAKIEALDHIIDLQIKQFNRWTQKDIANFFNDVGKYYRELKAQQEKTNDHR